MIFDAPIIVPCASTIGETVNRTRIISPSFLRRSVSYRSTRSPRRTRVRMSFISPGRDGEAIISMDRPIISSAEYPLGGWIPARDDAVEGLGNDGGLGGMHDRGEQLRCECVGKSGWPPRSFVGSGAGLGFRDAPARWRFLGFFGQRSGLVVSGCSA